FAVPGARVAGKLSVEVRIRAERIEDRGLAVGTPAVPAIAEARPCGDGIALRHDVLSRAGDLEEFVRVAARAGVRLSRQHAPRLCIVQGIVQPRDRGGAVAERGVFRHIGDAVAVDVDLTAIAQGFDEFGSGEGPVPAFEHGLRGFTHARPPASGFPYLEVHYRYVCYQLCGSKTTGCIAQGGLGVIPHSRGGSRLRLVLRQ